MGQPIDGPLGHGLGQNCTLVQIVFDVVLFQELRMGQGQCLRCLLAQRTLLLFLLLLDLALPLGRQMALARKSGRQSLHYSPPLIDVTTVFESQTRRGRGSLRGKPSRQSNPNASRDKPKLPFPAIPLFPKSHTFLVKEHTLTFPDIRDTFLSHAVNRLLFLCAPCHPRAPSSAMAMRSALSCDIGYPISPKAPC